MLGGGRLPVGRKCARAHGFRGPAGWGKKEAQIEIQAVAKIQYPIKSHII
jgi:hypothetical protein